MEAIAEGTPPCRAEFQNPVLPLAGSLMDVSFLQNAAVGAEHDALA